MIQTPPEPAPVVLIVFDDAGRDMLADAEGHTPNLDRLASEGLEFETFWAAPACSQFRTRMLTGRYAFRQENLVGQLIQPKHGPDAFSMPTSVALPSLVDGASYLSGKYHVAAEGYGTHPLEAGFDAGFYTLHNLGGSGSYYGGPCYEDGAATTWSGYVSSLTAAKALEAVQRGDRFVYAAFHAPHKPYEAPPDELHTYGDLTGATNYELALAMLEAADTVAGRLIGAALSRGYYVLACADNGTSGNHGGEKGTLREDGIRTWLRVAGPGVRSGTSPRLVDATDLWATVLELTSGQPWYGPDSTSFAGELLEAGAGSPREFLFVDRFSPNGAAPAEADWSRAIRDARWKVVWPEGGAPSSPVEFYDLETDPGETSNLLVPGPLDAEQQQALADLLARHPS